MESVWWVSARAGWRVGLFPSTLHGTTGVYDPLRPAISTNQVAVEQLAASLHRRARQHTPDTPNTPDTSHSCSQHPPPSASPPAMDFAPQSLTIDTSSSVLMDTTTTAVTATAATSSGVTSVPDDTNTTFDFGDIDDFPFAPSQLFTDGSVDGGSQPTADPPLPTFIEEDLLYLDTLISESTRASGTEFGFSLDDATDEHEADDMDIYKQYLDGDATTDHYERTMADVSPSFRIINPAPGAMDMPSLSLSPAFAPLVGAPARPPTPRRPVAPRGGRGGRRPGRPRIAPRGERRAPAPLAASPRPVTATVPVARAQSAVIRAIPLSSASTPTLATVSALAALTITSAPMGIVRAATASPRATPATASVIARLVGPPVNRRGPSPPLLHQRLSPRYPPPHVPLQVPRARVERPLPTQVPTPPNPLPIPLPARQTQPQPVLEARVCVRSAGPETNDRKRRAVCTDVAICAVVAPSTPSPRASPPPPAKRHKAEEVVKATVTPKATPAKTTKTTKTSRAAVPAACPSESKTTEEPTPLPITATVVEATNATPTTTDPTRPSAPSIDFYSLVCNISQSPPRLFFDETVSMPCAPPAMPFVGPLLSYTWLSRGKLALGNPHVGYLMATIQVRVSGMRLDRYVDDLYKRFAQHRNTASRLDTNISGVVNRTIYRVVMPATIGYSMVYRDTLPWHHSKFDSRAVARRVFGDGRMADVARALEEFVRPVDAFKEHSSTARSSSDGRDQDGGETRGGGRGAADAADGEDSSGYISDDDGPFMDRATRLHLATLAALFRLALYRYTVLFYYSLFAYQVQARNVSVQVYLQVVCRLLRTAERSTSASSGSSSSSSPGVFAPGHADAVVCLCAMMRTHEDGTVVERPDSDVSPRFNALLMDMYALFQRLGDAQRLELLLSVPRLLPRHRVDESVIASRFGIEVVHLERRATVVSGSVPCKGGNARYHLQERVLADIKKRQPSNVDTYTTLEFVQPLFVFLWTQLLAVRFPYVVELQQCGGPAGLASPEDPDTINTTTNIVTPLHRAVYEETSERLRVSNLNDTVFPDGFPLSMQISRYVTDWFMTRVGFRVGETVEFHSTCSSTERVSLPLHAWAVSEDDPTDAVTTVLYASNGLSHLTKHSNVLRGERFETRVERDYAMDPNRVARPDHATAIIGGMSSMSSPVWFASMSVDRDVRGGTDPTDDNNTVPVRAIMCLTFQMSTAYDCHRSRVLPRLLGGADARREDRETARLCDRIRAKKGRSHTTHAAHTPRPTREDSDDPDNNSDGDSEEDRDDGEAPPAFPAFSFVLVVADNTVLPDQLESVFKLGSDTTRVTSGLYSGMLANTTVRVSALGSEREMVHVASRLLSVFQPVYVYASSDSQLDVLHRLFADNDRLLGPTTKSARAYMRLEDELSLRHERCVDDLMADGTVPQPNDTSASASLQWTVHPAGFQLLLMSAFGRRWMAGHCKFGTVEMLHRLGIHNAQAAASLVFTRETLQSLFARSCMSLHGDDVLGAARVFRRDVLRDDPDMGRVLLRLLGVFDECAQTSALLHTSRMDDLRCDVPLVMAYLYGSTLTWVSDRVLMAHGALLHRSMVMRYTRLYCLHSGEESIARTDFAQNCSSHKLPLSDDRHGFESKRRQARVSIRDVADAPIKVLSPQSRAKAKALARARARSASEATARRRRRGADGANITPFTTPATTPATTPSTTPVSTPLPTPTTTPLATPSTTASFMSPPGMPPLSLPRGAMQSKEAPTQDRKLKQTTLAQFIKPASVKQPSASPPTSAVPLALAVPSTAPTTPSTPSTPTTPVTPSTPSSPAARSPSTRFKETGRVDTVDCGAVFTDTDCVSCEDLFSYKIVRNHCYCSQQRTRVPVIASSECRARYYGEATAALRKFNQELHAIVAETDSFDRLGDRDITAVVIQETVNNELAVFGDDSMFIATLDDTALEPLLKMLTTESPSKWLASLVPSLVPIGAFVVALPSILRSSPFRADAKDDEHDRYSMHDYASRSLFYHFYAYMARTKDAALRFLCEYVTTCRFLYWFCVRSPERVSRLSSLLRRAGDYATEVKTDDRLVTLELFSDPASAMVAQALHQVLTVSKKRVTATITNSRAVFQETPSATRDRDPLVCMFIDGVAGSSRAIRCVVHTRRGKATRKDLETLPLYCLLKRTNHFGHWSRIHEVDTPPSDNKARCKAVVVSRDASIKDSGCALPWQTRTAMCMPVLLAVRDEFNRLATGCDSHSQSVPMLCNALHYYRSAISDTDAPSGIREIARDVARTQQLDASLLKLDRACARDPDDPVDTSACNSDELYCVGDYLDLVRSRSAVVSKRMEDDDKQAKLFELMDIERLTTKARASLRCKRRCMWLKDKRVYTRFMETEIPSNPPRDVLPAFAPPLSGDRDLSRLGVVSHALECYYDNAAFAGSVLLFVLLWTPTAGAGLLHVSDKASAFNVAFVSRLLEPVGGDDSLADRYASVVSARAALESQWTDRARSKARDAIRDVVVGAALAVASGTVYHTCSPSMCAMCEHGVTRLSDLLYDVFDDLAVLRGGWATLDEADELRRVLVFALHCVLDSMARVSTQE